MLSHCFQVSTMLPLASTTTKQLAHSVSPPTLPVKLVMPPSANAPVPPFAGRLALVASRQGKRPIGKVRLGPMSSSFLTAGRGILGSCPRSSRKTRLALSANIPCPAPQVHFSFPGNPEIGFGQFWATSYPPKMSWPPLALGTAEALQGVMPCPCTVMVRLPIRMPAASVASVVSTAIKLLRIPCASRNLGYRPVSKRGYLVPDWRNFQTEI